MKGLGRNIRFITWRLNELFFTMLFVFGLTILLFGIMEGDIGGAFILFLPSYIIMMIFMTVMMNSISGGDLYLLTAVSMGATRKQSSIGSIIAQHIVLLEMGILLGACALLFEENGIMQMVRSYPLGTIGGGLWVFGLGILISAVSVQYGKMYGVLVFLVITICTVLAVVLLGVVTGVEINAKIFEAMNAPIPILVGLAVDLVASYIYCRVIRKVDLKLA